MPISSTKLRKPLARSTKPIPRKRKGPARRGQVKDPAYLEFVAGHRCRACMAWESPQSTPTEAAHVGVRGYGQKCDDREAIPLCERHHRTGPLAHHVLGKKFWAYHGLDREKLIADLNEEYTKF